MDPVTQSYLQQIAASLATIAAELSRIRRHLT